MELQSAEALLKNELNSLRNENEILQIQLEDCKEDKERSCSILQQKLNEKTAEVEEKEKLHEELLKEKEMQTVRQVLALESKLKNERSATEEAEMKAQELLMKLREKETQLEISSSKLSVLELQNAKLTNEISFSSLQLQEVQQQCVMEKKAFQEYRMAKSAALSEWEQRVEQAEIEKSEIKQSLQRATQRVEELQQKLEAASAEAYSSRDRLIEQSLVFKNEANAKDALIATLKSNLEEALTRLSEEKSMPEGDDLYQALKEEKELNAQLTAHLERILGEVEEKYAQMEWDLKEKAALQKQLCTMERDLEAVKKEKKQLTSSNGKLVNDLSILRKENSDLAKQVRVLLREIEQRQQEEQEESTGLELNADQIISERLLTFKNIDELQMRNQELLKALRHLSLEKEEDSEMKSKFDMLTEELQELKEMREQESEALLKQRNEYKELYERVMEENKKLSLESKQFNEEFTPNNSDKSHGILLENNRLKMQIEFLEERLKESKENCNFIKNELELSRTRAHEISGKIVELQGILFKQANDLSAARDEKQFIEGDRMKLQNEVKFQKQIIDAHMQEITKWEDETRQLKRDVQMLQSVQIESKAKERELLSSIDSLNRDIGVLKQELLEKEREIDGLRLGNSASIAIKNENDLLKSTCSDLEKQIEQLHSRPSSALHEELIETLKASMQDMTKELNDKNDEFAALTEQLSSLKEANATFCARIEMLEAELENERQKVGVLTENSTRMQEEKDEIRGMLMKCKSQLEDEIIAHGTDLQQLKKLQSDLEEQRRVLDKERERRIEAEIVMKSKSDEIQQQEELIKALSQQNQRPEIQRLEENDDSFMAFVRAEKDAVILENNSLHMELKRLSFQLQQQTRLIDDLKLQVEEAKKTSHDYKDLLEKVDQVSLLRESNRLLRREHEEALNNQKTLEHALNEKQSILDASGQELMDSRALIETLQQEKSQISSLLEQKENEIKAIKMRMRQRQSEENANLLKQNEELKQEREEMKRERDEAMSQREELVKQRDEVIRQMDEVMKEKDELISATASLEAAKKKAEDSFTRIESRFKQLIERYKSMEKNLKQEIETLKEQKTEQSNQSIQTDPSDLEERNAKLSRAFQLLKSKLELLTREKDRKEMIDKSILTDESLISTTPSDETSRLKSENELLSKKIEKLALAIQKFQQMKTSFIQLKQDIKSKDESIASLNSQIALLNNQLAICNEKLQMQKKEFELQKQALVSQYQTRLAKMGGVGEKREKVEEEKEEGEEEEKKEVKGMKEGKRPMPFKKMKK